MTIYPSTILRALFLFRRSLRGFRLSDHSITLRISKPVIIASVRHHKRSYWQASREKEAKDRFSVTYLSVILSLLLTDMVG